MSKKSKGSSAKKSPKKKASKPSKVKKAKPAKKAVTKKVPAKKAIAKVAKKSVSKSVKVVSKPLKALKITTEKIVTPKIEKAKIIAPQKLIKKIETKPVVAEIHDDIEPVVSKKGVDPKNSTEVLAVSNTIPKTEVKPLSASKIASISSSITNPVKKVDSYSVKPEKEPAGKYEIEFVVRSSSEMLYEFLSTPSGLSEWFCDDVNIRNGIYTFIWDGQLQQARLLKTIDDQLVRFQWVDKTDGSYFEFKIQKDDLTNDTSLMITDFADSVSERESSKRLWTSQVEKLLHIIGSIF